MKHVLLLLSCFCIVIQNLTSQTPVTALPNSNQLYFEENLGQFPEGVIYHAEVLFNQIRFTQNGISHATIREIPDETYHFYEEFEPKVGFLEEDEPAYEALVWNLNWVNSNSTTPYRGFRLKPEKINYLRGKDASKWVQQARRYGELRMDELYPSIDLRYYGTHDHQLKYDLVVNPGAKFSDIKMKYEGIEGLHIDEEGALHIHTIWGNVVESRPYSYQLINGRERKVDVSYTLNERQEVGYQIQGDFHKEIPVVIDPIILNWGSFIHSSTSDDYIMAVNRDKEDNVYVTGYTKSMNFPLSPGTYQATLQGTMEAIVAKLNPQGTALIYSTMIGGSNWEMGHGLEVNRYGEAIIAGFARSVDYPTTIDAYQDNTNGGLVESFVSKLSSDGDYLIFSSYFGGSDRDYVYDMAIGPNEEIYLTGLTTSTDFPRIGSNISSSNYGQGDCFLSVLDASGSQVIHSQLMGGSKGDLGQGVVVNQAGDAFVTGYTMSQDFPVTTQALQHSLTLDNTGTVSQDAFVFRINPYSGELIYSTYLGGSEMESGYAIAVNESDEAYLTGLTYSHDFPTHQSAFQKSNLGAGDVYICKINAQGNELLYSTLLGGTKVDFPKGIEINQFGEAFVLGATNSADFPNTESTFAYQQMYDLFLTVIDEGGNGIIASMVWGGNQNDYPRAAGALYVDHQDVTIGITTHSVDMPSTRGTFQSVKTNGNSDAPMVVNLTLGEVLHPDFGKGIAKWNPEKKEAQVIWEYMIKDAEVLFLQRKIEDEPWKRVFITQANTTVIEWKDHDAQFAKGKTMFYRLESISNTGKSTFSEAITLAIPAADDARVLIEADPTKHSISWQISLPQTNPGQIRIADLKGNILHQQYFMGDQIEGNCSTQNWSDGIYILQFQPFGEAPTNHKIRIGL